MSRLFVLVLMVCTAVFAISRVKDVNFQAINFARAINGKKLKVGVFRNISVDSEAVCQFACVQDIRCMSYNFATISDIKGKFSCQLSETDRFNGHENFTEDGDMFYRGIKSKCESDSSPCGKKGICIPNYYEDSFNCACVVGYTGIPCKPKSCWQLLQDGVVSSGLYSVNPDDGKPIKVLCDMITDGGGWTVFQRRMDGSVDFYLNWTAYKNGFGNLNGEFWLGNNNLHRLTSAENVKLRVDLEDFDGNITYAEYTTFKVADEGDKYRLRIEGYNGAAGDSMKTPDNANRMYFTTKDQDNDRADSFNCAVRSKGAWWYRNCHAANLNGLYHGGPHESHADGTIWSSFRGRYYSLKRTEMKIRPKV